MEDIFATDIDPLKIEVCDSIPVQTAYTMEELEESSLEEKVDLGNLVLFPPESYVNKAIDEVNFTIKEESSENKIDCDISHKTNMKKEVIESPVHKYEKTQIEFSIRRMRMFKKTPHLTSLPPCSHHCLSMHFLKLKPA